MNTFAKESWEQSASCRITYLYNNRSVSKKLLNNTYCVYLFSSSKDETHVLRWKTHNDLTKVSNYETIDFLRLAKELIKWLTRLPFLKISNRLADYGNAMEPNKFFVFDWVFCALNLYFCPSSTHVCPHGQQTSLKEKNEKTPT